MPSPQSTSLVYAITLPNGKKYIGTTTYTLYQAICGHKTFLHTPRKQRQKFYAAILACGGWDRVSCVTLEEFIPTKQEAARLKDAEIVKIPVELRLNENRGIDVAKEAKANKPPKLYRFKNPQGELVETSNVHRLCIDTNARQKDYILNHGALSRVWSGKLKAHNGWSRWPD